jgi:hypothetical protein
MNLYHFILAWALSLGSGGSLASSLAKEEMTSKPQPEISLEKEQQAILPGAWVFEQDCPPPSWWQLAPQTDYATIEIGMSYTWDGGQGTLHPYTRYRCHSGIGSERR